MPLTHRRDFSGRCMWRRPETPISSDFGAHLRKCTNQFDHFFEAAVPDDLDDHVRAVQDDAVAAPEWEGPPGRVRGHLHRGLPPWIPRPSVRGGNEVPAQQGKRSRFAARADRRLLPRTGGFRGGCVSTSPRPLWRGMQPPLRTRRSTLGTLIAAVGPCSDDRRRPWRLGARPRPQRGAAPVGGRAAGLRLRRGVGACRELPAGQH
jgi:hypothetical protein